MKLNLEMNNSEYCATYLSHVYPYIAFKAEKRQMTSLLVLAQSPLSPFVSLMLHVFQSKEMSGLDYCEEEIFLYSY